MEQAFKVKDISCWELSVDTVNGDWQSLDKANHDQFYQTSL